MSLRDHTEVLVSFTVTLPASAWDELTAGMRGIRRDATHDANAPDLSLADRIEMFIEGEISAWRDRCPVWNADALPDLDGDVPF